MEEWLRKKGGSLSIKAALLLCILLELSNQLSALLLSRDTLRLLFRLDAGMTILEEVSEVAPLPVSRFEFGCRTAECLSDTDS